MHLFLCSFDQVSNVYISNIHNHNLAAMYRNCDRHQRYLNVGCYTSVSSQSKSEVLCYCFCQLHLRWKGVI